MLTVANTAQALAAATTLQSPAASSAKLSQDPGLQPLRRSGPAPAEGDSSTAAPKLNLEMPRVVAALGAVIALIFLLRWGARRMFELPGGAGATRAIRLLSRSILAPKQHILLVQVGQRVLVVGDSAGQMNSLCEITDPDEVASLLGQIREEKTAASTKAFGSLFHRAKDQMGEAEPQENSETITSQESADAQQGGDPALSTARSELTDLVEKVRLVSRQFHNG